jgi:Ala-tRNA(Pro) deacylase
MTGTNTGNVVRPNEAGATRPPFEIEREEPMATSLRKYLRARRVPYVERNRSEAVRSFDVARATHLPGRGLANVFALQDHEDAWLLAVVPSPLGLDIGALALVSGRAGLRLASEDAVLRRFGGSALGSVAPFAEISGVPVCVDDRFSQASHIYFEDSTHDNVLGMRLRDYLRVAQPVVGHFALEHGPLPD